MQIELSHWFFNVCKYSFYQMPLDYIDMYIVHANEFAVTDTQREIYVPEVLYHLSLFVNHLVVVWVRYSYECCKIPPPLLWARWIKCISSLIENKTIFYDEYWVNWILLVIVATSVIRMINVVYRIQFAPIDRNTLLTFNDSFVMCVRGGVIEGKTQSFTRESNEHFQTL